MSTDDACGLSNGSASAIVDESLVKDGKNAKEIRCKFCGSVVLRIGQSQLAKKQMSLPAMTKRTATAVGGHDMLEDFWFINDMFTFENVAFSKTVGTIKYLACADCEVGPIGWHDLNDRKAFYVALDRVDHMSI